VPTLNRGNIIEILNMPRAQCEGRSKIYFYVAADFCVR